MFRLRSAVVLAALFCVVRSSAPWGQDAGGGVSVHAVGFDCAAVPRPPIAELVCGTPSLTRADFALAQVYYVLRQQVGQAGWQPLRQKYLRVLDGIRQACAVPRAGQLPSPADQMVACVQGEYERRRSAWLSRLTGAAAEEAQRPAEDQIALQQRMQQLGYLPATGTVDGLYGSATRAAVVAWQQSHNLPATGFLNNQEASALESQVLTSAGPERMPDDFEVGDATTAAKLNESASGVPSVAKTGYTCSDLDEAYLTAKSPYLNGGNTKYLEIIAYVVNYLRARYPNATTNVGKVNALGEDLGLYCGSDYIHFRELLSDVIDRLERGSTQADGSQKPFPASNDMSGHSIKIPSRESGNYAGYCREEWTKRGTLDEAMYAYCVHKEDEGYEQLVSLVDKYSALPWLQKLIDATVRNWTKRGARQDRMVAYEVSLAIDAYLDMQYDATHPGYEGVVADSCYAEYGRGNYPDWELIRSCYEQNVVSPLPKADGGTP